MLLKMTPSLYSSVYWYQQMENKSADELLAYLNREEFAPNQKMIEGQEMEDEIASVCEGKCSAYKYQVSPVLAGIVKGCAWQVPFKKTYDILGGVLLSGKADCVLAPRIWDIKKTDKYEVGKYEHSIQHLFYLDALKLPYFDYLPSDGKEYWVESYHRTPETHSLLLTRVSEAIKFLLDSNTFRKPYETNWKVEEPAWAA